MCFLKTIRGRKIPEPLIAKRDITVYKTICKNGWGSIYRLVIDGKKEKWKQGFHYYEKTPFVGAYLSWASELMIEGNAFHSRIKPSTYNQPASYMEVKMVIPKGAKYYKNDEEYVSSNLVWY